MSERSNCELAIISLPLSPLVVLLECIVSGIIAKYQMLSLPSILDAQETFLGVLINCLRKVELVIQTLLSCCLPEPPKPST